MADATDTSGTGERGSVHYPSDNLVSAIIRAWTDTSFKDRLLSYGERTDLNGVTPNKARTKEALAEMGIFVDSAIVLTNEQFGPSFQKPDPGDVIFVMPKAPTENKGKYSIATARAAMQFCIFGM
jgi:hypothetical protein